MSHWSCFSPRERGTYRLLSSVRLLQTPPCSCSPPPTHTKTHYPTLPCESIICCRKGVKPSREAERTSENGTAIEDRAGEGEVSFPLSSRRKADSSRLSSYSPAPPLRSQPRCRGLRQPTTTPRKTLSTRTTPRFTSRLLRNSMTPLRRRFGPDSALPLVPTREPPDTRSESRQKDPGAGGCSSRPVR